MSRVVTGAQALAYGAIEAGVSLVTSYAGGPATSVVNAILHSTSPEKVQVEWTSNEKVALELAFGGSMGGIRSMLCVKSVGFNIALDPLMTLALCGCNAGLVLLVGDDPGAWGSQNEQDSRVLALATELPTLEPTTVADAYGAMRYAFQLSEEVGTPVILRIVRALAVARSEIPDLDNPDDPSRTSQLPFQREFMRWVVLPINAVSLHRNLHQSLEQIRSRFEESPLNGIDGIGGLGVIAAGFAYRKLLDALGGAIPPEVRLLRLGTLHPLPLRRVTSYLQQVDAALVVEETAPLIEREIQVAAQRAGLFLPIYGRDSGHVSDVGELFPVHIAQTLSQLRPELGLCTTGEASRPLPSRVPLCDGCPYIPTFDALLEAMGQLGGRDAFVVVGDPGCIARAQLPPYELLDVKISLGSATGIAAGIAASQLKIRPGESKRVIAVCGDSSFLHSGLNGLIDAARIGAPMLVVILDNGTTALSGGQPHPATPIDARGIPRRAVDLVALARETGAGSVQVVDLDRAEEIYGPIRAGIEYAGVAVVIARGQCVLHPVPRQVDSTPCVAP